MLKNFLLLALLLDKTAADPQALRLPKGLPPLFSLQAPLKSSKEVRERGGRGGVPPHTHTLRFLFPSFPPSPHSFLPPPLQVVRAFLGSRLRGVGDALHPLELWGYRLEYVQCPADDFDYSISSLKEDLRSGIRLAKLYAVLTGVGECERVCVWAGREDLRSRIRLAKLYAVLTGVGECERVCGGGGRS